MPQSSVSQIFLDLAVSVWTVLFLSDFLHSPLHVSFAISRNNTAFWRAAARQEIYMEFLRNPPAVKHKVFFDCAVKNRSVL